MARRSTWSKKRPFFCSSKKELYLIEIRNVKLHYNRASISSPQHLHSTSPGPRWKRDRSSGAGRILRCFFLAQHQRYVHARLYVGRRCISALCIRNAFCKYIYIRGEEGYELRSNGGSGSRWVPMRNWLISAVFRLNGFSRREYFICREIVIRTTLNKALCRIGVKVVSLFRDFVQVSSTGDVSRMRNLTIDFGKRILLAR